MAGRKIVNLGLQTGMGLDAGGGAPLTPELRAQLAAKAAAAQAAATAAAHQVGAPTPGAPDLLGNVAPAQAPILKPSGTFGWSGTFAPGTSLGPSPGINWGAIDLSKVLPKPAPVWGGGIVLAPNPAMGPRPSIPLPTPVQPPISLGTAQGLLNAAPGDPAAAGYVAGVAASASSGHPLGIAAAEVLSLAQRLQIQAKFVAMYVGQDAANHILSGLHAARA